MGVGKPPASLTLTQKSLLRLRCESRRVGLLLLRIPNNNDLFNINVSRHAVFFQVKHIAFNFGRFAADRDSLTTNFDFFAQAVFKKISHSHYSFTNWGSIRL